MTTGCIDIFIGDEAEPKGWFCIEHDAYNLGFGAWLRELVETENPTSFEKVVEAIKTAEDEWLGEEIEEDDVDPDVEIDPFYSGNIDVGPYTLGGPCLKFHEKFDGFDGWKDATYYRVRVYPSGCKIEYGEFAETE